MTPKPIIKTLRSAQISLSEETLDKVWLQRGLRYLHFTVLILLLGGIGMTLLRIWTTPSLQTAETASGSSLPAQSALLLLPSPHLPGWQLEHSTPLIYAEKLLDNPAIAKAYLDEYQATGFLTPHQLKIERYSIVNRAVDVNELLRTHPQLRGKMLISETKSTQFGPYSRFAVNGQAYLSSCLNPEGPSSLTRQQFNLNRLRYDFLSIKFGEWLLSRAEIPDRRCVWVLASVPVGQSVEEAYGVLDAVWRAGVPQWRR